MADFFRENHKKSFNPDFDDSDIKSTKNRDNEKDNIEEIMPTNNYYSYDETN
jgi:hypothetical protein